MLQPGQWAIVDGRRIVLERDASEVVSVINLHWHNAWRPPAGSLLDNGVDLAAVQKILGHASPVTTSAYDRRPEETRRKALRGVHVPYLRKGARP